MLLDFAVTTLHSDPNETIMKIVATTTSFTPDERQFWQRRGKLKLVPRSKFPTLTRFVDIGLCIGVVIHSHARDGLSNRPQSADESNLCPTSAVGSECIRVFDMNEVHLAAGEQRNDFIDRPLLAGIAPPST